MDNPLLYSKANAMQKLEMNIFMENHMKRKKFDENSMILDVGSADGSMTKLLKSFVGPVKLLLGLDLSEKMVEFSKSHNVDKNVEFVVGNVEVVEDLKEFLGVFDYVVSSFCLHWVKNQTQAWENIYGVLKPGGQVCAIFLSASPMYPVYEIHLKNPKWSSYGKKFQKYFPPYLYVEDPVKAMEKYLTNSGFVVEVCKTVDRTRVFVNQDFKKFMGAVDPFVGKLPEDLVQDYLDDYQNVFIDFNHIMISSNENENSITLPYQLFHIVDFHH